MRCHLSRNGFHPRLAELGGEALDRRLVGTGVAEEDVEAGHPMPMLRF
jgi:hypothetical protein